MAKKTFVELVNDALLESGAELRQYSTSGSDFNTSTDSLMVRMKEWTRKAWKTIQQDADDWQFLTSRGVVNLAPRIMFYSYGEIPGTVPPSVDIYNSDDEISVPSVAISGMTDLTDGYSSDDPNKSYGFIELDPSNYPVTFTVKPGNDYFYLNGRLTEFEKGVNINTFYDQGISVGRVMSVAVVRESDSGNPFVASNCVTITEMVPFTNTSLRGTTSFKFTTNNRDLLDYIDTGDYSIYLFANPTDKLTAAEYIAGQDPKNPPIVDMGSGMGLTDELIDAKAYIHSWGSYDWNEELADSDFTDHVKEVNTASYKIIRTSTPDPYFGEPLVSVPWDSFIDQLDRYGGIPADPAYITKDSQGRWRLGPTPKERVTVTFDYVRRPQILTAYNDIPEHLDEEYQDLIMWRTLMFYAKFDEQPGLFNRAQKEYMDIKLRFEKNKRPAFHFKPANFRGYWGR